MSSAPTAPHDFEFDVVRRGYRPDEVDAHAAALSRDRDAAWERAARLTVLAREMGTDLDLLRETVAGLRPQTYEALGGRARELFELGVAEGEAVREGGRDDARRIVADAEEAGQRLRGAAQAYADKVRGEAEERARQVLLAAQTEADELRIEARRVVKEGRGEALATLRETRERAEGMLTELQKEYDARVAGIEREVAEREAAFDAGLADRAARAEAELVAAERGFAEAEADVVRMGEEAEERAAEALAEARRREEWVARETERVLREHGERWDEVRAHMDCIRESLSALTE
ncbi:cellulose-binding protein [Streptomyces sp. MB09-02B]|uniref:cellulose-binding protein n=1 Tax=Streptomyces sp. MB09-02B TaxID=3028667 RepID=UPI0029B7F51B|nr:cellulose-binding protein [Streptomyces sp. MB09-02B]MDX3645002.1 cellulose-binding protein [Streptomyces sp. MB09-02B]